MTRILDAAPGEEQATADAVVRELEAAPATPRRVLSAKSAHKRLQKAVAANPKASYTISGQDLLSLLSVLAGTLGTRQRLQCALQQAHQLTR